MLEWRNVIEQRILARRVRHFEKFLQTFPAQLGIVIISKAVRQFLVVSARGAGLIIFFGEPGPPIESRRGLVARGIHPDLFVKLFFGFLVSSKAQGEPGCFPMSIRSTRARGKALLQLAKRIERRLVLMM